MSAADRPPVARALDDAGVPYELFLHAGRIESLEQAARERGQDPGQVIRSLLFRLSADSFAMVLVAGPGRVEWRTLRQHVGRSRISQATEDEVRQVTGYELGTVGPFGLRQPVRILVDDSVLAVDVVSLGSGRLGTAVIMRRDDLLRALGPVEVGRFAA